MVSLEGIDGTRLLSDYVYCVWYGMAEVVWPKECCLWLTRRGILHLCWFKKKKERGREALFVCTIASVTSGRLTVLC